MKSQKPKTEKPPPALGKTPSGEPRQPSLGLLLSRRARERQGRNDGEVSQGACPYGLQRASACGRTPRACPRGVRSCEASRLIGRASWRCWRPSVHPKPRTPPTVEPATGLAVLHDALLDGRDVKVLSTRSYASGDDATMATRASRSSKARVAGPTPQRRERSFFSALAPGRGSRAIDHAIATRHRWCHELMPSHAVGTPWSSHTHGVAAMRRRGRCRLDFLLGFANAAFTDRLRCQVFFWHLVSPHPPTR